MRSFRSRRPVRPTSDKQQGEGATHAAAGLSRRQVLRSLLASPLVAWLTPAATWAAESPIKASTSRDAYEQALRKLPLGELRDDARKKLQHVVESPSIYRRLPVEVIDCDPDLYLFLIRYPEIVVNMWQLMGITKVKVQRTSQFTLDANDGAGTASSVELVYSARDKHVIYGSGQYEGPLLRRRITGKCVLLLQSGYTRSESGRPLVSSQLDVFVELDNVGADFVAKTIHPLVGRTADHNFSETAKFLGEICQQAEANKPGMQRLAQRLTSVDPEIRQQFADVTGAVAQRRIAALP
jgi:hypothetical protein